MKKILLSSMLSLLAFQAQAKPKIFEGICVWGAENSQHKAAFQETAYDLEKMQTVSDQVLKVLNLFVQDQLQDSKTRSFAAIQKALKN